MKNKWLAGLMACLLVLSVCVLPVHAEEDSAVSTQISDMVLSGNCGGNYVRGNGMRHSPPRSWLYANENGGVTLVQYVSAKNGVTVAEFDGDLNFLNARALPVTDIRTWGGFCAGKNYHYVVYTTDIDVLRVDQYNKDWTLRNSCSYTVGNTTSLISNDLDICEGDGSLYIVSNHIMVGGHQANFRLQISAENLGLQVEQSGIGNYSGYCSHSYVPEVVYSGGTIYAFDRSDSVPGTGIYMSVFNGGLNAGSGMRSVKSMRFNDWGSQGNAVAAPNDGVLTAYTFADWNQDNTATDVYLYYASPNNYGSQTRVSYGGGAGTPYVMSVTDTYGYVLWNTDLYDRTKPGDNLYCAVYTLNSGSVTVGAVRTIAENYLSDCEPIRWNGGLLWFTYAKELTFHQIEESGVVSKKVIHTPVVIPGQEATCAQAGLTEGSKCSVCGTILVAQAEIPALEHIEEIIPGKAATCTEEGLTEGLMCGICDAVLVEQQVLEKLPHGEVQTPYVAPTFTTEGCTEGTKCDLCGQQLSGGEVIPMLEEAVQTEYTQNGELQVTYLSDGEGVVVVAFYDESERCMAVQFLLVNEQAGTAAVTMPEGSRSYQVLLTDTHWQPKCVADNGTF